MFVNPTTLEEASVFHFKILTLIHSVILQYSPFFLIFDESSSYSRKIAAAEFICLVMVVVRRVSQAQFVVIEEKNVVTVERNVVDILRTIQTKVDHCVLSCFLDSKLNNYCRMFSSILLFCISSFDQF